MWGTTDETRTAYLDTTDVAKMTLAALRCVLVCLLSELPAQHAAAGGAISCPLLSALLVLECLCLCWCRVLL